MAKDGLPLYSVMFVITPISLLAGSSPAYGYNYVLWLNAICFGMIGLIYGIEKLIGREFKL